MTLGNMRENGVRAATATCIACTHKADAVVDGLPDAVFVPDAARLGDLPLQRQIKARLAQTGLAILDVEAIWLIGVSLGRGVHTGISTERQFKPLRPRARRIFSEYGESW
jgi:hypothetical protein